MTPETNGGSDAEGPHWDLPPPAPGDGSAALPMAYSASDPFAWFWLWTVTSPLTLVGVATGRLTDHCMEDVMRAPARNDFLGD